MIRVLNQKYTLNDNQEIKTKNRKRHLTNIVNKSIIVFLNRAHTLTI